jgi:hypothetical protein
MELQQQRGLPATSTPPVSHAATACADTVLTVESPTFVLRPDFANVHSFDAAEPTAILDLQMPPYSAAHGRDCHYFRRVDETMPDAQRIPEQLRVIAAPPDLCIKGQPYTGPLPGI